jgi:hypothetical protein
MFRGTFWIRSWSILSREEGRSILKEAKVAVCWRLVLWSFSKVVGGMF